MRDELLERERNFWNAMRTRDGALASRLSDDNSIVIGPQGVGVVPKAAIGDMIENAPYTLERFTIDERSVQFRQLAKDVAFLTYKVSERLVVDGKPLALDAYEASVWVRKGRDWVCVLHTETLPGDPFGRDRMRQSSSRAKRKPARKPRRTTRAAAAGKRRQRA